MGDITADPSSLQRVVGAFVASRPIAVVLEGHACGPWKQMIAVLWRLIMVETTTNGCDEG
ncbi:unnamed protein product, partial [Nippostrongylus brasiliensis]|uniref:Thioredoxin reductase n=1 Tax=Nippostrongylus brasiliensis TaxID=27835 RepID=A0A0N4YUJ4_NIPBR